MNFILEINRSLSRVIEVLMGNCIYVDRKIITKKRPSINPSDFYEEGKNPNFDNISSMSNYIGGSDEYFTKLLRFQKQSEYRIIWKTDRSVTEGIIITCPEAIKYCEKITL